MKKSMSWLLVFGMLAASAAGCGTTASSSSASFPTSSSTADSFAADSNLAPDGMTHKTGLPLVKEPVTFKTWLMYNPSLPEMETHNVWAEMAKETGITLELEIIKDKEKVGLLFASREFPDISLRLDVTDQQLMDAGEGSDILDMTPYLAEYAPTWNKFFQDHPTHLKRQQIGDSKLYTLPAIDLSPARNLRDQWAVNKKWLEQVGKQAPTTTDEYLDVLRAFRSDAGKGIIPANAAYEYFQWGQYTGGPFDLFGAFGVYVSNADWLTVVDGKVSFQATNPDIKEPLKYMAMMYKEGLIPPDVFTDDRNTVLSKQNAVPTVLGVQHGFGFNKEDYVAIAPPKSPNGKQPYIRRINLGYNPKNCFAVFSNCKYPAAAVRLAEFAVDPKNTANYSDGLIGSITKLNDQGKYEMIYKDTNDPAYVAKIKDVGYSNYFVYLKQPEDFEKSFYIDMTPGERDYNYDTIYKNYVPPMEMNFNGATLAKDDNDIMTQYGKDLKQFVNKTFANWIIGEGDIDAQWDKFVADCEKMNLAEYLTLKQQSHSLIND